MVGISATFSLQSTKTRTRSSRKSLVMAEPTGKIITLSLGLSARILDLASTPGMPKSSGHDVFTLVSEPVSSTYKKRKKTSTTTELKAYNNSHRFCSCRGGGCPIDGHCRMICRTINRSMYISMVSYIHIHTYIHIYIHTYILYVYVYVYMFLKSRNERFNSQRNEHDSCELKRSFRDLVCMYIHILLYIYVRGMYVNTYIHRETKKEERKIY